MKIIVSTLAVLLSASSALAGDGQSNLSCFSDSGRTSLTAVLSGGLVRQAELTIDGQRTTINENEDRYGYNVDSTIIQDLSLKVLTFSVTKTGRGFSFVEFYAIPSTVQKQGSMIYKFRGKVVGTEPRPGYELRSKLIEVDCRLYIEAP